MSVEIEGDITTIVEKDAKRNEPVVLVWSISDKSIETRQIDNALEKLFASRNASLEGKQLSFLF